MRKRPSCAFTLIEVITAMAVILVLTGLVIQFVPYVTKKPGNGRAQAEIAMLSAACESYKEDFGAYPQDFSAEQSTNKLKPKRDFKPTNREYELASLFLYKALTGDKWGRGGVPDGIPDEDEPRYLKEFDPKILKTTKDANNRIIEVKYIQDPFGHPYGYSTAAVYAQNRYLEEIKKDANTPPPKDADGFNNSSFDLWSTRGSNPRANPSDDREKELEWAKWIKNW